MTAPVRDPHRHVLTVPVSDEQLAEDVAAFLAEGLTAGERVAYFDDDTAGLVLSRLADDGVDVTGPLRSGQFQLVPGDFTRAALHAPLDELTGVMEQNITSALDDGWAGLRFSGQMDHGLRRPGGQVLDEYDRRLDDAVRDHPLRALCVYDHLRYPDELIATMRSLHPAELTAAPLYDDSLLRVTEIGPARVRLAGEVDHANRPQVRRVLARLIDRVVRGDVGEGTLTADLSALRFVDVAGAVSLVHAADELPVSVRLRLVNLRPGVARLLERCGAGFASQLEMSIRERHALCPADALGLAADAAE
ncbi:MULTISPECIES: MEDS domain-containing protein [Pseudonocardia]|uniref:MEDS domain-containing protein n=1 Tax=Pseudonocardia TaxID=1847 RepID=UPI000935D1A9|nr:MULTISPECIES: MEDS domain-containing protein [Pseudonocardia]MCO7197285.1 MEDS domain-containing protein [Pseudonocardia sp. McavD-2-B]